MLTDKRLKYFNAFYASLTPAHRNEFLLEAEAQREGIQEGADYTVSLLDCLENVWDYWRELQVTKSELLDSSNLWKYERTVKALMLDPARQSREADYFNENFKTIY